MCRGNIGQTRKATLYQSVAFVFMHQGRQQLSVIAAHEPVELGAPADRQNIDAAFDIADETTR